MHFFLFRVLRSITTYGTSGGAGGGQRARWHGDAWSAGKQCKQAWQATGPRMPLPPMLQPTSGLPLFFFLLLFCFSAAAAAGGAAAPASPLSPPPSPLVSAAMAPDTPASLLAFHRLYSSQSLGRFSLNSEGTPGGEATKGREFGGDGGQIADQRRRQSGGGGGGGSPLPRARAMCATPRRQCDALGRIRGLDKGCKPASAQPSPSPGSPRRTRHGIILHNQGLHRGPLRLGHAAVWAGMLYGLLSEGSDYNSADRCTSPSVNAGRAARLWTARDLAPLDRPENGVLGAPCAPPCPHLALKCIDLFYEAAWGRDLQSGRYLEPKRTQAAQRCPRPTRGPPL